MTDRPKWFVWFEQPVRNQVLQRPAHLSSSWVIYTATSGRKQQKLSVLPNMAFGLQECGSAVHKVSMPAYSTSYSPSSNIAHLQVKNT